MLGKMKPSPSFRILCKAAIDLAECFRKLHAQGLCYKDINLGGPFIDPSTGDVMICDTDNVRVNKTPGNIIFIFFAAPELIRNEGICQTNTDIHSLAVLLVLSGGFCSLCSSASSFSSFTVVIRLRRRQ